MLSLFAKLSKVTLKTLWQASFENKLSCKCCMLHDFCVIFHVIHRPIFFTLIFFLLFLFNVKKKEKK